MSEINVLKRPHPSELDLSIEHVLKYSNEVNKSIYDMVINREFDDKTIQDVKYKFDTMILLLDKIEKGFKKNIP